MRRTLFGTDLAKQIQNAKDVKNIDQKINFSGSGTQINSRHSHPSFRTDDRTERTSSHSKG